jgi:hypothetical protein
MGVPIDSRGPALRANLTTGDPTIRARLLRESSTFAGRQYLITAVAADRSGLLAGLAQRLAPPGGTRTQSEPEFAFSIDGSVASALLGTFSVAAIVRVVDDEPPSTAPSDTEVAESLKARVHQAGFAECDVERFTAVEDRLFDRRLFDEYRFELIPGRSAPASTVLQDFASGLADREIPIAYLRFPDPPGRDRGPALRVAIGSTLRARARFATDLLASSCAQRHGTAVEKYDAALQWLDYEKRFVSLRDLGPRRQGTLVVPAISEPDQLLAPVFTSLPAEPGRVAHILRVIKGSGATIEAGVMMVLGGYTIATWLVPDGQQPTVQMALASDPELQEWGAEVRVPKLAALRHSNMSKPEGEPVWVGWRCRDIPGVMATVLDSVAAALGRPFNVEYSVSRVLADAETCAGKILVTVPGPEMVNHEQICSRAAAAISPFLREWNPSDSSWLSSPVMVGSDEPWESPWGGIESGWQPDPPFDSETQQTAV